MYYLEAVAAQKLKNEKEKLNKIIYTKISKVFCHKTLNKKNSLSSGIVTIKGLQAT